MYLHMCVYFVKRDFAVFNTARESNQNKNNISSEQRISRQFVVKVQCLFCNGIVIVWKQIIHRWLNNYFEEINNFPKNSPAKTKLNFQDEKKIKMINNFSDISNTDNSTCYSDKKTPINKYKKKEYISYSGGSYFGPSNCLNNTNEATYLLQKSLHKKLLHDDVRRRFDLLNVEKELYKKIKQVKELEKSLRIVQQSSARERSYFESRTLNDTLAYRRRSTFFRRSLPSLISISEQNSNHWSTERNKREYQLRRRLISIEEETA